MRGDTRNLDYGSHGCGSFPALGTGFNFGAPGPTLLDPKPGPFDSLKLPSTYLTSG